LAEHKQESARKGSGSRNGSSSGVSAAEAIARVKKELPPLLGKPLESVLGVERGEDGWQVMVQVTELSRIPSTTDVLAAYAVTLDEQGELIGYRRRRRYYRNQVDED
jgi:hypothetical protein